MWTGLELEFRQAKLYIALAFLIFYLTKSFLVFLFILATIGAATDQLDPEEADFEEELWPFIENTYIETNWWKGNLKLNLEFRLKKLELKENLKGKAEDLSLKKILFKLKKEEKKKNKIFLMKDLNILSKI